MDRNGVARGEKIELMSIDGGISIEAYMKQDVNMSYEISKFEISNGVGFLFLSDILGIAE
ncbi:MAG: hypothetical protein K2H91_09330 [Lachnospiraceae bacterium]|nr:hypothetical protein [Lachnospiraceae bacterium]